jgi:glycosyltransferase involved in cell wall biosynthesis
MEDSIHISVIMPTFNQCTFIRRAIGSLIRQSFRNWELIIINDGCTDETEEYISDYIGDFRISYIKNDVNTGLGHSLNQGLDASRYEYVAYLPSDDFYFPNHLESLASILRRENVVLAYSGLQYDTNDSMNRNTENQTKQVLNGYCMQLVQTAHKKYMSLRWLERGEYLSEDLFLMFWHKMADKGFFVPTNSVSCFWTSHPHQRHRILSEKYGGGLNKYRNHYKPCTPLKVKVSRNKFIDEEELYKDFRMDMPTCNEPLKMLVVGELAYYPERLYALEQAGHILYGLWDTNPMYSFTTVGPLPFGHVKDLSIGNWEHEIAEIKPDIIYGLLSSSAVPFVYEIVKKVPHIPYVWCFKEGPSMVLKMGNWEKLIYLYQHAAGRIFLNEVAEQWYNLFLPPSDTPTMIMDGELPKGDYFKDSFSPKLSETIGGIHTVVTGRMIGISEEDIKALAQKDIHIHLYTQNYYEGNNREGFVKLAPNHFHVHQHVFANKWTEELSQYDAGWIHCHKSKNGGNMLMTTWDDLNLPARIATYATAGLPIILPDNSENVVASNIIAETYHIGLVYKDREELINILKEEVKSRNFTKNMMICRMEFSFDLHVPRLVDFFRLVIKKGHYDK